MADQGEYPDHLPQYEWDNLELVEIRHPGTITDEQAQRIAQDAIPDMEGWIETSGRQQDVLNTLLREGEVVGSEEDIIAVGTILRRSFAPSGKVNEIRW